MRLHVFLITIIACTFLENVFPRRNSSFDIKRSFIHLTLIFIGNFSTKFIPFLGTYYISRYTDQMNLGLFQKLSFSPIIDTIIIIILFDCLLYWQHVLTHRISFLWRIHRVHHSDQILDASSALRFHPFEILFSTLVKGIFILSFGVSPEIFLICEIILNSSAIFNHSNIFLPKKLDQLLSYVIITPDKHRLHHSNENNEMNKNYGFCLSWWDKVFCTYRIRDIQDFELGLKEHKNINSLADLLKLPFK